MQRFYTFVTRSIVYNILSETNINIEPKMNGASPVYLKYSCCTYNLNLDSYKNIDLSVYKSNTIKFKISVNDFFSYS
jgi:hypothetical protein